MAEERVRRRLEAILVADIVGYHDFRAEEADALIQLPKLREFGSIRRSPRTSSVDAAKELRIRSVIDR